MQACLTSQLMCLPSLEGPSRSAERPGGACTPREAQPLAVNIAWDMLGPSGVGNTVQDTGQRPSSPSSSQIEPVTDHELHCLAEIAAALQEHLLKPHVYETPWHTAPPSITVSAVEDWLSSACMPYGY